MHDRKYVDALVEQYLTPRHRQMTTKMKESERQQTNFPRIRKGTDASFKITDVKVTSKNSYVKPTIETKKPEVQKEELASTEPTIEEKFIEHVEANNTITKKSGKGKLVGIIIGIIVVMVIGGGAAYMGSSSDLFSAQPDIGERITCQDEAILVSTTKVPNFPTPGKDLKYYQDRYDNEPKYKEWFDKNFQGQTIREVLVPQMGDKETIIPGFPDPEKDLQHYLDRYDNEPKYKEWFDKNFQGQTIREAVC